MRLIFAQSPETDLYIISLIKTCLLIPVAVAWGGPCCRSARRQVRVPACGTLSRLCELWAAVSEELNKWNLTARLSPIGCVISLFISLSRVILLRVIISKITVGKLASKMFYSYSCIYFLQWFNLVDSCLTLYKYFWIQFLPQSKKCITGIFLTWGNPHVFFILMHQMAACTYTWTPFLWIVLRCDQVLLHSSRQKMSWQENS